MTFNLSIIDWQASAPGLAEADDWRAWSQQSAEIDDALPLPACIHLPMMTARRLSSGSRLAVECGLAILKRQPVDAVVYASRHGELERHFRILQALHTQQPVSPTDFAMSVHNAAVGNMTIAACQPLVSSSVSSGVDTFQQALFEVLALHHAGYERVMLVDFDGLIPAFYTPHVAAVMPRYPFAVGLLLQPGDGVRCRALPENAILPEPALPQSLQFLHGWLAQNKTFVVPGARTQWHWSQ